MAVKVIRGFESHPRRSLASFASIVSHRVPPSAVVQLGEFSPCPNPGGGRSGAGATDSSR